MSISFLEKLLLSEEDSDLEFKQSIDLETNEGKVKFLKEMLALANSCQEESYLVVGVEDKTKKVIGAPSLSEEQLQQVVSDNCSPPMIFSVRMTKHDNVDVGIITIFANDIRPYTLKKPMGNIKDTDVFIRHGSVIHIATPEEIVKLAQSRSNDVQLTSRMISQVGRLEQQLEEIAYSIQNISGHLRWGQKEEGTSRFIECAFIGMTSGIAVGWLSNLGFELAIVGAPVIVFMISVLASTLNLVKYGILRTIFTSIFIGIPLSLVFFQFLNFVFSISAEKIAVHFVLCAVLGTISGVIGSLVVGYFENRGMG